MTRQPWSGLAVVALALAAIAATAPAGVRAAELPDAAKIAFRIGERVPLRDGTVLSGNLYLPKSSATPAPCVLTMTPYTAQTYHDRGVYFAARGLPFLAVDVRGRGNSEGTFRPLVQESQDGYDVVEWLARQPYCNGKIAMWGGSYAGYDQWATAKARPPHLATIVPVAAPYAGADFPYRNNIAQPYLMQWLTFVSGKASQVTIFGDTAFWDGQWRERFERGAPFDTIDRMFAVRNPVMAEWLEHPAVDAYFDAYNPSAADYRAMTLPILTITGSYDDDQPGSLSHYRAYMAAATPEQRARHLLVIGPWDHAGTRTPVAEVGGLRFGPASLVDLPALHADWYRWTMAGGPRPAFLKDAVAYYVMGADLWRYAPSLEAVTVESRPYFLDSAGDATAVVHSGQLAPGAGGGGTPDSYRYDPHDTAIAAIETGTDQFSLIDQRTLLAGDGHQLVYHTAPFAEATELSGSFRLAAWISIDQPDTDLRARVYEIDPAGQSILLTTDMIRARYRESLRQERLVTTTEPLRYDFNRFTFTSRRIAKGSRLRLVIDPLNSIYSEKNYNSGKRVSSETMADARTVTVRLFHDRAHPSALYLPFGRP